MPVFIKNILLILLITPAVHYTQIYDLYDLHKKLFESNGLEVRFLFYSEGNGLKDNGVNVLLINRNQFEIEFEFHIIFKSDNKQKTEIINGILKPGEIKTGSTSKLFFLPFNDGTRIKQVGATKIKVKKKESLPET